MPEPAHLTAGGQLPTSAHLPRAGGQCPPGKGKWAIAHLEKVSGRCPPGKGKWAGHARPPQKGGWVVCAHLEVTNFGLVRSWGISPPGGATAPAWLSLRGERRRSSAGRGDRPAVRTGREAVRRHLAFSRLRDSSSSTAAAPHTPHLTPHPWGTPRTARHRALANTPQQYAPGGRQ